MFSIKRPLVRLTILFAFAAIGLLSGAHEAFAQNPGSIANPALLPNAFNPNTIPNQNSIFNPNPFQNPNLFVNPPNLVQPLTPVTSSVNPNAAAITDPLGNPYPFVNPNPIINPNGVTPSVTPNSSTLPNQGIGAGPTGTMPITTGTGIVGGVAPSGGAGNPSGVGGREFDQIVE
jgi:hypothetical protein